MKERKGRPGKRVRTRRGMIRDVEQIRALRSPVRQAILDTAQALGTCSAADLARELGRPADGLYYHLRALTSVGLLVEAGSRGDGRRQEGLYATASPREGLWLVYDPADLRNAGAVTAAVGGMLRLTDRSFAAAFRPDATVTGPRRNLWAARVEGWLSPTDLEEVNALLQRLRVAFARPRAEGRELHALTFALVPMAPGSARRRRAIR